MSICRLRLPWFLWCFFKLWAWMSVQEFRGGGLEEGKGRDIGNDCSCCRNYIWDHLFVIDSSYSVGMNRRIALSIRFSRAASCHRAIHCILYEYGHEAPSIATATAAGRCWFYVQCIDWRLEIGVCSQSVRPGLVCMHVCTGIDDQAPAALSTDWPTDRMPGRQLECPTPSYSIGPLVCEPGG